MVKVFVADAHTRHALAVGRSLAKNGYEVTMGATDKSCPAFHSRHIDRTVVYPAPKERADEFIDFICDFLVAHPHDVLLHLSSSTGGVIAENLEILSPHIAIPVPGREKYQLADNKAKTTQIAQAERIPVPLTYFIENFVELENLAAEIPMPAVIKTRHGSGGDGVVFIGSRERIVPEYLRLHAQRPWPIIQEYIPSSGGDFEVQVLLDGNQEIIAGFALRHVRKFPLTNGPSTYRESCSAPEMMKNAIKLLRHLGWSGFAAMDLRLDPRDQLYKLLEINPRLPASINLAIASGIDFPSLQIKQTLGQPPIPVIDYPIGTRSQWLFGDIYALLSDPEQWQAWPELLPSRSKPDDILSREDPVPVFHYALKIAARFFSGSIRERINRGRIRE
ncbi:MAG: ATP-grasp domain-containing protein [Candidatus Margulisiibacteriota bacterium]